MCTDLIHTHRGSECCWSACPFLFPSCPHYELVGVSKLQHPPNEFDCCVKFVGVLEFGKFMLLRVLLTLHGRVDKSKMFTCLTDLARPLNSSGSKYSESLHRYRKSMNQKQNKEVVVPNRFGAATEFVRRYFVFTPLQVLHFPVQSRIPNAAWCH